MMNANDIHIMTKQRNYFNRPYVNACLPCIHKSDYEHDPHL